MPKYYAQLNENNICVGVSQLSGEVNAPNMIPIPSLNTDYLWRKYENGSWSAEKLEPVSSAPVDDFEQLKQDNINIMLALTEVYEMLLGGAE